VSIEGRHSRARRGGTAGRAALLLQAALLGALVTTTVSLTTARSMDALVTLGLHYPLFVSIAWLVARGIPSRWRTVVSLSAIPLVAAELVALRFI
jgi:hypothetical protein